MADKKISALTALTAANVAPATDVVPIVDTSATETKKVTAKDLVDGALNGGTANGVLYLNGSKAATSGSALVFDGTNLGLGITPSAWVAFSALQASRGSFAANGAEADMSHNAFYDGAWKYIANGFATNHYQTNGTYVWRTAPSGTAGNAISFTQAMTLDASGNLGIGTSSPAAKLDVQAAILDIAGVSTTGTNYVRQRMTNTGGDFYYGIDGSAGANFGFPYAAVLWYTGNNSMVFGTNNSRRMEIDGSGNVMAGGASLATTATNGFLYVPTCAGVPTGTPTAKTGYAPIVVDTTNNRWYFYSGGAWRNAGP